MSTRNKLLESIVLALGGTVTNPNNRNQLLYDWLTALSGAPPSTRLAPNFNGVSQKGSIASNVSLSNGDTIKFKASKPTTDFATVMDAVSRSFRLRYRSDGTIQIVGLSGTVNGVPINSLSTLWPDGISEFELTINTSGDINSIGSRSDSDVFFFDGFIFDFSINDGAVHNYIMNDGDGIMRNTGSGADGSYPNWTVVMWQQVPL